MTDFIVVIPARYASTRFPGKPLAMIDNKTMLEHVHDRALEAGASKVIIATDDTRIEQVARAFGGDVCMTSTHHQSGTTRIAEVIALRGIQDDEIVVNVQGDEPFIPSENIRQVAHNLASFEHFPMATLCYGISSAEDVLNPNVVKVTMAKTGHALYFSRAAIPFPRSHMHTDSNGKQSIPDYAALEAASSGPKFYRHIGIYAYRASFVSTYSEMEDSMLEQCESLEQLRALENGYHIHVDIAKEAPPHGVDTPEDLAKLIASK